MTKRVLSILLALLFPLCACDEIEINPTPSDPVEENQGEESDPNEDPEENDGDEDDPSGTGKDDPADVASSEETPVDESEFTTTIDLVWSGENVTVTNNSSLKVTAEKGHVTVGESGAAGQKVRINLSGSSSNGSLKIYNGVKTDDTNKKMLLSFNGVNLVSGDRPAVNIQSGKTVYVVLNGDNSLKDASSYTAIPDGEDAKGCFFSEKQLVFSGDGKLSVTGVCKHAICVDDYVCFQGGNLVIPSSASDGLHVNAYVRVEAGTINITSAGEGIQCEKTEEGWYYQKGGTVTIATSGSKCGGIETALDILIIGGKLDIKAGGTAAKCLKSDNNVTISGGTITLSTSGTGVYDSTTKEASAAACIKAENIATFNGGTVTCTSTGKGGKGINCYKFLCEDGAKIDVTTSGSTYTYSNQTCRPKAIKATAGIVVNGGEINATTTGTEGEGLESKTTIEINGGKIVAKTKDDGFNAAQTITFNGGFTYVYATGNDGIDSNYGKANSIVFNGGVVMAHSASSPEEGFDADSHSYLTFNGGYVLCTGGLQGGGGGGGGWGGGGWGGPGGGGGGSSSTPSCKQSTVYYTGSVSTGYFTVTDSSDNVIMSCYVPRSLSSNYSLVSGPFTSGETYKYGVSSSAPSGATEVFGTYFYSDGTCSGLKSTFKATSGYSTL